MKSVLLSIAGVIALAGCEADQNGPENYKRMSCSELAYQKGHYDAKLDAARAKAAYGNVTAILNTGETQTYGQTQAVFGGIEENRALKRLDQIQIIQAVKRC